MIIKQPVRGLTLYQVWSYIITEKNSFHLWIRHLKKFLFPRCFIAHQDSLWFPIPFSSISQLPQPEAVLQARISARGSGEGGAEVPVSEPLQDSSPRKGLFARSWTSLCLSRETKHCSMEHASTPHSAVKDFTNDKLYWKTHRSTKTVWITLLRHIYPSPSSIISAKLVGWWMASVELSSLLRTKGNLLNLSDSMPSF